MIFVAHRCWNAFFWPFLNATKLFFSFWKTKKKSYGDRTKSLPFGSQVRRFKNLKMRVKKSKYDENAPLSLKMILWSRLRWAGTSRFHRTKWSFLKFILNIARSWRSKNGSEEQEEWRSVHFWAYSGFWAWMENKRSWAIIYRTRFCSMAFCGALIQQLWWNYNLYLLSTTYLVLFNFCF